jgi:hypothetical protein
MVSPGALPARPSPVEAGLSIREARLELTCGYRYATAVVRGHLLEQRCGTHEAEDTCRVQAYDSSAQAEASANAFIGQRVALGYVELQRNRHAGAPCIDLKASEWLFATWRPRGALQKASGRPFDVAAFLEGLLRPEEAPCHGDVALPPVPSLGLGLHSFCFRLPVWRIDAPSPCGATGVAERGLRLARLAQRLCGSPDCPGAPLPTWLLKAFMDHVLAQLSEGEREALRAQCRPHLHPSRWPASNEVSPSAAFHLAALLGMHEALAAVVESWPDGRYRGGVEAARRGMPHLIVYGLGSPESVRHHTERLGLDASGLWGESAGWLAHTELAGLERLGRSVQAFAAAATDAPGPRVALRAQAAFEDAFGKVHAAQAASWVLALSRHAATSGAARKWLVENLEAARQGLAHLAQVPGHLHPAALQFLQDAG